MKIWIFPSIPSFLHGVLNSPQAPPSIVLRHNLFSCGWSLIIIYLWYLPRGLADSCLKHSFQVLKILDAIKATQVFQNDFTMDNEMTILCTYLMTFWSFPLQISEEIHHLGTESSENLDFPILNWFYAWWWTRVSSSTTIDQLWIVRKQERQLHDTTGIHFLPWSLCLC